MMLMTTLICSSLVRFAVSMDFATDGDAADVASDNLHLGTSFPDAIAILDIPGYSCPKGENPEVVVVIRGGLPDTDNSSESGLMLSTSSGSSESKLPVSCVKQVSKKSQKTY